MWEAWATEATAALNQRRRARGLTKPERHAMRVAVRSVAQVTMRELWEMHPHECLIARAEMRKRGFKLNSLKRIYRRRFGLDRMVSKSYDERP